MFLEYISKIVYAAINQLLFSCCLMPSRLLARSISCFDRWCFIFLSERYDYILCFHFDSLYIHSFRTSCCNISSKFVGHYARPMVFVCTWLGILLLRLSLDCGKMPCDLTWFFWFSIEMVLRIMGIATFMLWCCPVLDGFVLIIVPLWGYWTKCTVLGLPRLPFKPKQH